MFDTSIWVWEKNGNLKRDECFNKHLEMEELRAHSGNRRRAGSSSMTSSWYTFSVPSHMQEVVFLSMQVTCFQLVSLVQFLSVQTTGKTQGCSPIQVVRLLPKPFPSYPGRHLPISDEKWCLPVDSSFWKWVQCSNTNIMLWSPRKLIWHYLLKLDLWIPFTHESNFEASTL